MLAARRQTNRARDCGAQIAAPGGRTPRIEGPGVLVWTTASRRCGLERRRLICDGIRRGTGISATHRPRQRSSADHFANTLDLGGQTAETIRAELGAEFVRPSFLLDGDGTQHLVAEPRRLE